MLQRALVQPFPDLSFYQASPAQPPKDWLPEGVVPKLCILNWNLSTCDPRQVADEIQNRWPRTPFIVFCREDANRPSPRIGSDIAVSRACGVAADFEEMMRLAVVELSKAGPVPENSVQPNNYPDQPSQFRIDFWNSLPFGMALVSVKTRRVHFANETLRRWLGLSSPPLPNLRIDDLHSAEAARRITASIRCAPRGQKTGVLEASISVPGRGGRDLDVAIGDAMTEGEPLVPIYYLDATERRTVERKLRRVADAVATAASGREFFQSLVTGLARVLDVDIAAVCRVCAGENAMIRSLATYVDGEVFEDIVMPVEGFPAARVLEHQLICVARQFRKEFPSATWMTDRRVESYMGLPVTTAQGEVIGMIQVMDRKPLTKTKDLRAVLLIFATRVAAEMTRLANEEALEERERLMREAEKISGLGSWEWSVGVNRLTFSEEGLRIIGLTANVPTTSLDWAIGILHPDDRATAKRVVEEALKSKGTFEESFRVIRPTGEIRWVQVQGKFIADGHGKPVRMAGVFLDMTEKLKLARQKEAFSRLGHLLSTATTKLDAARIVIKVAESIFEVDAAAFDLRDAHEPESFSSILSIDTFNGAKQEFPPVSEKGTPTSLQQRVLRYGAQLIHRDQEEGAGLSTVPFGVESQRSATIMVVPLRHNSQCIGVLSIHSYRTNAYTQEDLRTLQSLADTSAPALLRVDAEDEARKKHEMLRIVTDSLPALVAYVDNSLRYQMVNRLYERWFRRPRPEIEGREVADLLPQKVYQHIIGHANRALRGEAVDYEIATDQLSGLPQQLHITYVPHVVAGGQVAGFVGLVTDITSMRATEGRLKESVAQTQFIVDNAAAMVFLKDCESRYILVNKMWEKVTGLRRDHVIGKRSTEVHPTETARQMILDEEKVITQRATVESEEVVERNDTRRTFLTVKFPLVDTSGKVYGVCGIATDITRRKSMEHSLRQISRRLETAQRIAHIGNWELYLESSEMWWSDETYRLLGMNRTAAVPSRQTFLSRVHPEDREAVTRMINQSIADKLQCSVQHRVITGESSIRYVRLHSEVVTNESGRPVTITGAIQDVTDQREIEQALRASEEKFRIQYEAMPLPTFIWRYNGSSLTLVESNPASATFTEGMINLVLGKTTLELFPDAPDIAEDLLRCYREKCYFTREFLAYRMRTTGKIKQLRAHVNYVAPDMVVLNVDDMTERLQAEARQRAILQIIPYRLFRLDRHGVFLDYHASRPEEMLLDPKNVLGRNFREVLPPETAQIIDDALRLAASTGKVQLLHYTLPKAGITHYLEGRLTHCGNSEFLVMVQDISAADYRRINSVGNNQ